MDYTRLDYPIPYHSTWEVLDASKIQTGMTCMRKYFYSYILGWRMELDNHDLHFGKCLHEALAFLNTEEQASPGKGLTEELASIAFFEHFLPEYRRLFPVDSDAAFVPKDPSHALIALREYVQAYAPREERPLWIELGGTVPITSFRTVSFKIDLVYINKHGIVRFRDYKTTKAESSQWMGEWQLSFQMFLYNHVMLCFPFPDEIRGGGEVCGVVFLKSGTTAAKSRMASGGGTMKFLDIPVRHSRDQMLSWYHNCLYWLREIDKNMEILASSKPSDVVLEAFPMNTQACWKYGRRCAFQDFCIAWRNPLERCSEIPYGFKQEFWDPRSEVEQVKTEIHLEQENPVQFIERSVSDVKRKREAKGDSELRGVDQGDSTESQGLTPKPNNRIPFSR